MRPAYLIIIQVLAALTSFASSFLMAGSIVWFGSGAESTPYKRIILGLSISDILQSLALLVGPFSVPTSKMSLQAANEVASCQANGFFLLVGSTAMMLHTIFLCVYYLCKLKYRMSNDAFKYKVERKMRAFIVIFSLIAGIVPLVMNVIHTNSLLRSFCNITHVPTGCTREPEEVGECDATNQKRKRILASIFVTGSTLICFAGMFVSMGLLYHHTYVLNKNIQLEVRVPTTTPIGSDTIQSGSERDAPASSEEESKEENEERDTPRDRVQQLSRLYRREMMTQATCYVVAFCLMYTPVLICYRFDRPSELVLVFLVIFYPLGGFLNILIYTRPKVASLRRTHPECPRLRGFWLVLKAGGEIPDNVEPSWSCCENCCRPPVWLEESRYEFSYPANSNNDHEVGQKHPKSFGIHLSRVGF